MGGNSSTSPKQFVPSNGGVSGAINYITDTNSQQPLMHKPKRRKIVTKKVYLKDLHKSESASLGNLHAGFLVKHEMGI